MDDEKFLRSFEECTLPFAQWHHRAHIKVAYLYLRQYSLATAIERVRAGIKALNAAHQVPEAPYRGYHETMTQAWVRLVHVTLCEYGPGETADEFFEQHPQLSQKKVLRLFYSRERFMSPQAKVEFLEPDLAPLPKSVRQSR
ncbi:MAG: Peptidyl-tRNA hydrolase, archaeal type [Pedosphaera sp.]|nr:Peptidyl-tRNA hydrolase, archaeal type [Pedosphaera sp.]